MLSVIATIFALALALAEKADGLSMHVDGCQFGEVYQTNSLACEFSISNAGDKAVKVTEIHSLNSNDIVEPKTLVIPSFSSVSVRASLDLLADSGQTSHQFELVTDSLQQPKVGMVAEGFVDSILDNPQPRLKLGTINLMEEVPSVDFSLSSEESPDLRITRLVRLPPYLEVKLGASAATVQVSVKRDVPWGLHHDPLVVETNNPSQKFVELAVDSDIHGNVVPSPNPVSLGLIREGNHNEATIRLDDVGGKSLQLGALKVSGVTGTVKSEDCIPTKNSCRLLKLTINDGQVPGAMRGALDVELPKYHRILSVRITGIFLKANAVVHDMDMSRERVSQSNASNSPTTSSIADALQQATHQRSEEPVGTGPLLSWQVANEGGMYGYIVYRSDRVDGSYVRLNSKAIPVDSGAGDGVSSSYKWRDESATAGQTYWYYISSIRKNGVKQKLTGPQKVVAK